jgi:Tol biopolymer transport system component
MLRQAQRTPVVGATRRGTRPRGLRLSWRALLVVASLTLLAPGAQSASASDTDHDARNGRIVFGRFDTSLGDFHLLIADSRGAHQHLLLPRVAECPRWSPDGRRLVICMANPAGVLRPATINADGSGLRILDIADPALNLACDAWARNGATLLCEGWDDARPDRAGLYSVRARDGGGLTRVTRNPFGGHDIPGDYSPDGTTMTFVRVRPGAPQDTFAVFTANTLGGAIRQVTPYGLANCCFARWEPGGDDILFTSADGSLYTVHPDGRHLQKIVLDIAGGGSYAFAAGWSPDASRVIFSMYRSTTNQVDIYTASASGRSVVQVTNTPEDDDLADWGRKPSG